ncbi:MAG: septal ring lytic transglycosylase RlpA family protein [Prosthecobacter sp.]
MKSFKRINIILLASSAMLVSCAPPAYTERGMASYVADHYAGHPTSSGEIYYPQGWTAAHNTLPFGTQLEVKNNYNGRSVNVVVNDRFPHYPGRVINLSRAAAETIQIPYMQMADVTVTARNIPGQQGQNRGSSQNAPAPPPPTGYGAPPAGYGAAPAGYGAAAPPAGYGAPPAGYGAPPAGAGTTAPPSGLPPPPSGYPDLR